MISLISNNNGSSREGVRGWRQSWLTSNRLSKCVLACEVILVVLLAWQLASLTWMLIPVGEGDSVSWQAESAERTTSSSSLSYQSLDQLHLFGVPDAPKAVSSPVINPDEVPRSRLSARITGIVASSRPERSLAIINHRSSDDTYRIGDKIKGTSAEVVDIYPDRVIVLNKGQHEALLLYPNERQSKTAARPAATRQDTGKIPAGLMDRPASVLELISVSPVRREGELVGYRLNPKKRPEQFAEAGLKSNDIALSINGYDLTDQGEAMKLLKELSKLDRISLTVERNGQIYQIDFSS